MFHAQNSYTCDRGREGLESRDNFRKYEVVPKRLPVFLSHVTLGGGRTEVKRKSHMCGFLGRETVPYLEVHASHSYILSL